MTSRRPSTPGRLLAAVAALVAVAVGAATNILTGALPEDWRWAHDWRLWAAVLAVLCGVTVWLAVTTPGQAGQRSGFGYGRRYRRWVVRAANTLDTKGLVTVGPTTPDLEAVFVDVALTERAPTHVGPGLLGGTGGPDVRRRSVWAFLDRPRRVVLVLLGARWWSASSHWRFATTLLRQ